MTTLYAAIGAAATFGFILGLWLRPFLSKFPFLKSVEPQDISMLMDRIVNQEAAEQRRHELARMLHDSKRRTMRVDGGKPAHVHKMRRVRRVKREPL